MKKISLLIFCLFISVSSFSQSDIKRFFKLSAPMKIWVLFHPFKVKKSYKISLETNKLADSIAKTNLLDKDGAGGQVDAFRHAYWMMRLKQEVGEKAARSLGKAHERDNYITFKKNKKEDGVVPDKISSEMDLYNNEEGLKLISKKSKLTRKAMINRIVIAIRRGKFIVVKKDSQGDFLNCSGGKLSKKEVLGKWKNNKCLEKSNYVY
jgi:hypothetical protein